MPEASPTDSELESERLDVATDEGIAACDGDVRGAVRALIVANEFLEWELARSYMRGVLHGRFKCYSG